MCTTGRRGRVAALADPSTSSEAAAAAYGDRRPKRAIAAENERERLARLADEAARKKVCIPCQSDVPARALLYSNRYAKFARPCTSLKSAADRRSRARRVPRADARGAAGRSGRD